ncbi:ABC transporter substrate-binding protein [Pusillimonas sp.]|uniref:ABC transporter substrate-binding protein n=1 Tax=Pusillimonas sp. TaxID=3040095 RepID=UPI0029A4B3C0|nr:ABC transporter substrate-binding protein [Pusillimonas sp.]MDX3895586.1 ABC transporter substrate-binding protein [Pusillimonas sp.]
MAFSHGILPMSLLALAAFAFQPVGALAAQQPLKIGFVAELSGPQGALGQDQYDGFMLVVERNGGKLGGHPVQILKEDSKLKPDVGVQVVQKLMERDHVPIITGITFSNIMMAVHKLITDNEVFLVGSNAGPSPIAGAACSPYQFIVSWQQDDLAEVLGEYSNQQGYKRVYLMAPNFQAGKDFLAGIKRTFKGEVVKEVYTPLNQPDFSAELTQLAAAKPDAVFVFYPGGLGVNFVRQYQQAGLMQDIPLMSGGIADATVLAALRESALGIKGSFPWGPDLQNDANRAFVAEFEKKYKRIPSPFAANGYDSAQLLDSAIAKVNGDVADKKAFMAALKAADFASVRGDFAFGPNHFPIQDYHVQQVVKDDAGRINIRTIATPFKSRSDSYASQCPLN